MGRLPGTHMYSPLSAEPVVQVGSPGSELAIPRLSRSDLTVSRTLVKISGLYLLFTLITPSRDRENLGLALPSYGSFSRPEHGRGEKELGEAMDYGYSSSQLPVSFLLSESRVTMALAQDPVSASAGSICREIRRPKACGSPTRHHVSSLSSIMFLVHP